MSNSGHSLIPTKNSSALVAYYCGIFSLIPCLAFILGALAVVFGFRGLQAYRVNPSVHGRAHSMVGIILGGLTFLANLAVAIALYAGR